ncbi:MAG: response regulator [Gammaproteobacteria bacterium]|nr:response regulator [Gammaproteobacteria bacterium]
MPGTELELNQESVKKINILHVEDNPDDAELLRFGLLESGLTFELTVVDTLESLRKEVENQDIDVVITDHNLASFTSIEVMAEVSAATSISPPILIVSGAIGEELATELIKAGAHDYLIKDNLFRLGTAIDNAIRFAQETNSHIQSQQALAESEERYRQLVLHLERLRENERRELARDIHDDLGGNMVAIKLGLSHILQHFQNSCPNQEILELIHVLQNVTEESVLSMRRIISDLRPSILDDLGLVAAIEWLVREFESRYKLKAKISTVIETEIKLPNEKKTGVFRIIQEALTNVAKHADANLVVVHIFSRQGNLSIEIRDNGKGFTYKKCSGFTSYGIVGMEERANALNGSLIIDSTPENGTSISAIIPLTE